jgi:hypothetical protein
MGEIKMVQVMKALGDTLVLNDEERPIGWISMRQGPPTTFEAWGKTEDKPVGIFDSYSEAEAEIERLADMA